MRESMSRKFIIAFVSTCEREGLSKEATAELLQRQSVLHACEQSPAFAAGFTKIAAKVPGELRPLARAGYFEKRANGGFRQMGRAGLEFLGGAGKAVAGGGRNLVKALDKTLGPARTTASGTTRPLVSQFPRAAAAAGLGLGVGTAAIGAQMLGGRNEPRSLTPYMPPGGFNPEEASASYDKQLDQHSRGLAEHNKKYFGDRSRREVLQQAVDSNSPNSAQALAELTKLDRDHSAVAAERAQHLQQLDSVGGQSAAKLQKIQEQQAAMERAKTSWTRAPHRAWLKMTGRNPNDYFDNRRIALEGEASAAQTTQRLSADQLRRLENGYIGGATKTKTPGQLQQEFFPTY